MLNRLALIVALVLPGTLQAQEDELGGASRPNPGMSLERDWQYKRVHQLALRYLLLDRAPEAKSFLEDYVADHGNDAETAFLMGLLEIDLDNSAAAIADLEQAITLGLDPGRLVAGPRQLLEPVKQQPLLQKTLQSFANQPVHGPLVGHMTDASASFWVRTAGESNVRVDVRPDDEARDIVATGTARSTAASDFTCVVTLNGLKPATRYSYVVRIDDHDPPPDSARSFRTFPAAGQPASFRIAFGGGAGYVPPHERMWDTIRNRQPDAILLLGDNVYIDDPESPEMQRYTYYRRQSRPEWRALTSQTPVFTIWDDHDFSTNDSWGGPLIDKPFWKKEYAFNIYRQNWANPAYAGGDEQPGCWYSFAIGDVDFIMLDCRYYRTDPNGDNPSMLGPVQMAWLKDQLRAAHGTFKVICSSVPWDFRTKGDSQDTWNGYQAERKEIFDFLTDNAIEGVVLMSADRHRSDAWQVERPGAYDLYEFNSSRLTNQHVHATMEKAGAVFSYNAKQSFGLVTFDTTTPDPQVTYEVISIDNETVHALSVHRSQLQ